MTCFDKLDQCNTHAELPSSSLYRTNMIPPLHCKEILSALHGQPAAVRLVTEDAEPAVVTIFSPTCADECIRVKGALEVMPDFQSSLQSLRAFFSDNEAASMQTTNKENLQPAGSKAADTSAAMPAPPSRMVPDTVQPGWSLPSPSHSTPYPCQPKQDLEVPEDRL